jgi:hypothetical protein
MRNPTALQNIWRSFWDVTLALLVSAFVTQPARACNELVFFGQIRSFSGAGLAPVSSLIGVIPRNDFIVSAKLGGPKIRRGDFQNPYFKGFLAPVLVPVCTLIWCDWVQFVAKLRGASSSTK